MASKIRAVIALDGEKEFKAAVTDANTALNTMKSALQLVEEQCKNQSDSLESLSKKHDALSNAITASKEKEEALQKALNNAVSNYNKVGDGLEELNKQYEEEKKKLEQLEKSGQKNTSQYKEQEEAVNKLATEIEKGNKNYQTAENRVNKWQTQLNKAETETAKMTNELKETDQQLEDVSKSADNASDSIDDLGDNATSTAKASTTLGEKLKIALANKTVSVGIDALKSGLQELGEAAKAVVEVGSEFEASMSNVAAISGATGDDLDSLTEKAQEMGETTKYTASQAADAFSYMALAGWDTEEMLSGIDGVLNLAAAADMDLAEASDIVTDYLTAFGLSAEDSAEFVDMMAYAMANSNTTVEDLGEAYKNCAATASSLGYSAEEVTAVLATMANAGVKGGEAGTALNTIMTRLATDTKSCATALAEYGVNVYDSEGNMNSLSSILEGMSDIWADLTDQEQASLAKTIAGTSQYSSLQTIMSGLTDEAKESGKSFSDYAEALEDCTGTAEEMAETMQDNLQGDMTKMQSALQGLGIAAYDYVKGPLRGVVQGVTDVISDLTDAISPQESAIDSLVSSAEAANSAVSASISNRTTTLAGAEQEAAQVENLGNRLMELNEVEDKTTAQKAEMKQIVDELSESIPELVGAYDEETGSLSLTNEELQTYIDTQKESIINQALLSANEELITSLVEAQTQLDNVSKTIDDLSAQNDIYDSQIADIEKLEQAYTDGEISQEEYQNGLMGIASLYGDLLESGQISMNTLGADLQKLKDENNETLTSLTEDQEKYQATIDEGTEIINQNTESAEKLADALFETSDAVEETTESAKNYALAVDESAESVDDSTMSIDKAMESAGLYTDGMKKAAASTDLMSEAEEDATDSTEELESALDDAATAAEKSAEAQESAFDTIYDAYTTTFESIKSDLNNKLDLSSKFDGGDDTPVTQMIANLQDQVEGLETYQENLEKVKNMTDETGASIFSDEMIQQLEEGGTDMANTLARFVTAWETEGEAGQERVKTLASEWAEYLDLSDEIASAGAANQTAYELAMGELGSSEVDFSRLTDAVNEAITGAGEGWSDLTAEEEAALNEAITMAQSMGVQIPDGLTDAIASGETSAAQATEQLNSAIQGTLEGLLKVAQDSGASVDETLAASITDGTADAQSAMTELMSAISDSTGESSEVGTAMETAVAEGQEVIEGTTDSYAEGGESLGSAVADGIAESTEEISAAVEEAVKTGADSVQSDTNIEAYKEAGKTLGEAIADGIAEGADSDAITDAAGNLVEAVSSGLNEADKSGIEAAAADVEDVYASAMATETLLSDTGEQAAKLAESASSALNDADKSGIQAAGADVEDAYASAMATSTLLADVNAQANKLAAAALAGVQTDTSGFKTAGYNMSAGVATGIALGQSQAVTAAINMAKASLNAAKSELGIQSPSKKFKKDVGEMIGKGMASGISSSSSEAEGEAESMSTKVYTKAVSWLSKYKKSHDVSRADEKYYWKQIAAECEEGTAAYNKAISKMIKASVSTTTTSGSGSNKKTTKKDTETYYSDIYDAAVDYMDKLQTLNDVSLDDQLSYWEAIKKQLKKGTDAWYDAQKEINAIKEEYQSDLVSTAETEMEHMQILSDVSTSDQISYWKDVQSQLKEYSDEWYNVTEKIKDLEESVDDEIYSNAKDAMEKMQILGDVSLADQIEYWEGVKSQLTEGSDAWYEATEKINDLTESIYDTMYSAAEKYASNMDTLDAWSLDEQLAYWEAVADAVEEGSDAWYSAQSKINSIKSNIGTVSNMSSLLNAYKTYYDMSEKAEMEYWDIIRQQYEEGTDERLEADQNYLDAKEEYYDKLEELEEDYADSVTDIEEKLADDIADLEESYNSSLQDRIDTIKNAYNLFDEFTSESADGQTLLFNLQSQAAGYEAWSDALDDLADRGILSDELLEELTEMGPEELAAIYALTDLTDEELTAYQEAYDRKMTAATKQAEEDTATLKAEMETQTAELKAQAAADLAALKSAYDADVASVNTTITSEMKSLASSAKTIAEDQTTALVNALKTGGSTGIADYLKALSEKSTTASTTAATTATAAVSSTTTGTQASGTDTSGGGTTGSNTDTTEETTEETDKILEIINSAPKKTSITSAEKKEHHDLWVYLVEKYSRKPNNPIYAQLAEALGVTLADTSKATSGEKDKILKKLKNKGYRTGGRNINDPLVWMDEELDSLGPEMVVSRSDNALLTRIPAGSDIIDAKTTDNLLRLANIDPDELMSVMAKQQDMALACLNEINSAGTAAQLNDLANISFTPAFSQAQSIAGDMISDMYDVVSRYLPYLESGQVIQLDSGEVVGGTVNKMSNALAQKSRRRRA